ncbi:hypothetical protein [uncultured Roseobacter sp.]|uniref:hypothetical protein n=1 Tax=uncultured Roseobacter sp. TaxID=114847 RepID=UPI00262C44F3|nr:hypothetical protein [uncultured Roseobacter sp.]
MGLIRVCLPWSEACKIDQGLRRDQAAHACGHTALWHRVVSRGICFDCPIAIIVQPLISVAGRTLSSLAALTALAFFGRQKYFDAQFALIWPAVILGQLAALVIFIGVFGAIRRRKSIYITVKSNVEQV